MLTNDPEVSVLLASKARVREVFRGCGGTNGNRYFSAADLHQAVVRSHNFEAHGFRNFLGQDEFTNECCLTVQLCWVVVVQALEVSCDLVVQLGVVHDGVESVRSHGKSGRNGHTRISHNDQRGALTAKAVVFRGFRAVKRERVKRHCLIP